MIPHSAAGSRAELSKAKEGVKTKEEKRFLARK
jgi:hypothetical protein